MSEILKALAFYLLGTCLVVSGATFAALWIGYVVRERRERREANLARENFRIPPFPYPRTPGGRPVFRSTVDDLLAGLPYSSGNRDHEALCAAAFRLGVELARARGIRKP